jgi:hypothetical protein
MGIARRFISCARCWGALSVAAALWFFTEAAIGQTCLTADDLDAATRTALENAGRRYFELAAKADMGRLKEMAIPSVAADFAGIQMAVRDNQEAFAGAQVSVRPPFLLEAQGKEALARAEFLCGVFGKSGQTPDSAVFVIPNLPPGTYAVVIVDATGNVPHTLSLVLQKVGNDWKLAGFYAKPVEVAGHDGKWFWERAREFKTKGQTRNAWLYYNQARDLLAPVPFMSTMATDEIYDEAEPLRPQDLPSNGNPVDLSADGRTYRLTSLFAVGADSDVDLVVKFQTPDISNSNRVYQDNVSLIKVLVAKHPEFRDGFAAIIARAVDPSGKDFGTLLTMKDIK